jgi:hypothetical protein
MNFLDLLASDEPTVQEKAQAMAAALRKQNSLGVLGQISGDPYLGKAGSTLSQQSEQGEQQLATLPQQRLKLAMGLREQARQQALDSPENASFRRQIAASANPGASTEFMESLKNAPSEGVQEQIKGLENIGIHQQANVLRNSMAEQARQHALEIERMKEAAKLGQIRTKSELAPVRPDKNAPNDSDEAKGAASLGKDLDASVSSRSPFGQNQIQVNKSEKLMQLLANGNNLDVRQQNELAIGLAAILSGSNAPAQETIHGLVPPKTLASGPTAILEWLLNEPRGTGQQAFVKRMAETLQRERDAAQGEIVRDQLNRITSHQVHLRKYPDSSRVQLQRFGLLPYLDDNFMPKTVSTGGAEPKPGVVNPKGPTRTVNGVTKQWNGSSWEPVQ